MKLYYMPLGAYGTNCYIVHNEADNTCLVTDPGDEGEKLKEILDSHEFKVQGILLTHGHSDHIGAVKTLVDAYHVPVYSRRRCGMFDESNGEFECSFWSLYYSRSR
mgnify:CR=1 FL=1